MEQQDTIQRKDPALLEQGNKEIFLAGGCFWGTQKYVSLVHGVLDTSAGYINGPAFQEVFDHASGYADGIHVVYDPTKLSLGFLLELYFKSVDPTSINKQGENEGVLYRTGIYYTDENDLPIIQKCMEELQAGLAEKVAIEVGPLRNYYIAKDHHQDRLNRDPGAVCHIPEALFEYAAKARENQ
ncbi:peptide-methionine (S)-S-oxide reductase MsrA [Eubacteriales bacterium OttesenSCG-928-M02]|nr:peptide-methionine (S)-S-oxide reductase MsrA [Eubacteriales bacterium OttesenSCG-928-M02]